MVDIKFKAIAFDLDGTLVDSVPDLAVAAQLMLNELTLPSCSELEVRSWVGNGAEVLVRRALAHAHKQIPTSSQVEQALVVFLKHYHQQLNQHSCLYDGVKETLLQLIEQGYQLAVVTNKPIQFVAPILKAFEIDHCFSLILGGDSLEAKKPDPMPLNYIISEWALKKDQLLMVGDSKNDILAAKSAGIASIGLTYGYNYGEDIGLSGSDAVFDDFSDILSWVLTHFKLRKLSE
ncbi:phosphoglycolate phosphatase [Parashewanella spongiae]|uniref:Phosphoglycolate phosphatase n=1 Tax=Parashewanella spongiae TaxID=342950 RepID=A0A3A6TNU3_9GAMM|nr:phosphoglycolate phosphatase [Parashewanella spongiae]MCL1078599.1 phosphoglycolate phosphatase [Parashewanella spongiae]RJY13101.1 phosphoglycolate phosphatase [Parashewanella spongiae]